MEKSNLVKGFIFFHKEVPYGIWSDEIYTPLQVNTDEIGRISVYGGVADNECEDSISRWNNLWAENTGTYYIWKTLPQDCKYVVQMQYRRRLDIRTEDEINKIFERYKAVVPQPIFFQVGTLRTQYAACHSVLDLERGEKIVKRLYPEYCEDFDRHINHGKEIYNSNGFALRAEDYKAYCGWLFNILSEFKKEMGWEKPEDVTEYVAGQIKAGLRRNLDNQGTKNNALRYQSQIFGFLSERLFTLWIKHNFKPEELLKIPYHKLENCF